jgi:S1-C subfamily serine protease
VKVLLPVLLVSLLWHPMLRGESARLTSEIENSVRRLTVKIVETDGTQTASGVLLSADGYFLTKASEWPLKEKRQVQLAEHKTVSAREIHRDDKLDLLFGQCVGVENLPHATWGDSRTLNYGHWLLSASDEGGGVLLGVFSAQRRKIERDGVAIGVRMEDAEGDAGVRIAEISSESPAELAGLMKDDVLVALNGKPVTTFKAVKDALAQLKPGDEVEVKYKRGDREQNATVRLASRRKALGDWSDDFANGGVSTRTDDFPEVIQHAIPLNPEDMGGAIFNLKGEAVGINIARTDRVTTFALPVELFWPQVQKWMEKDRGK